MRGKGEESSAKVDSEENSPITNYQLPITNYQLPKVYQFWEYNQKLESSLVVIVPPPTSETVLDILGPLTLATDGDKSNKSTSPMEAAMQSLRKVYQDVSQQAVLTALNRGETD